MSAASFDPAGRTMDTSRVAALRDEIRLVRARYPRARSAVMPSLHLGQAAAGCVTPQVVAVIAEELQMSRAEVTAVASFYTMYLREPGGQYRVGVCTNSLCAILGGDEIWDRLVDHAGQAPVDPDDPRSVTVERIECQAACTHAPVMTLNWELLDNQTPQSAVALIDRLRGGEPVAATRGRRVVAPFADTVRSLAGVDDPVNDDDVALDAPTLVGLRLAEQQGPADRTSGRR